MFKKIAVAVICCWLFNPLPALSAADLDRELFFAAREGDLPAVNELLSQGADPSYQVEEYKNKNAVMEAAGRGHKEILLAFFWYPPLGRYLTCEDMCGENSIFAAVKNGRTEIVKLLIEYGIPVNKQGKNGSSPLLYAIEYGYNDIARILLDHDADVNARHRCGDTPLMAAAKKGDLVMVQALLDKNADLLAMDNAGRTALALAMKKGHHKVAGLLREKTRALAQNREDERPLVSLALFP